MQSSKLGQVSACLITPTQIYLINCGDSRGLIVSDNQIKIATKDHNPDDSIELERIKKADGYITKKKVKYYVHQLNQKYLPEMKKIPNRLNH